MGELINHLDFWLMIVGFGAILYYLVWKDRVQPFIRTLFPPQESAPGDSHRRARRRPTPVRGLFGRFAGSEPVTSAGNDVQPDRNEGETRFDVVSAIAMPQDNTETIAFHFLARLVKAGYVTETQVLETACGVKAGSSKAYQEARAKLKKALEDQNNRAIIEEPHRAVSPRS